MVMRYKKRNLMKLTKSYKTGHFINVIIGLSGPFMTVILGLVGVFILYIGVGKYLNINDFGLNR